MRALTSASNSTACVVFSTKMASGTPQARWRDKTQSGRSFTMPARRFSPDFGYHFVSWIAVMARARSVSAGSSVIGLSIATNHCGVARKITGALERQLCG